MTTKENETGRKFEAGRSYGWYSPGGDGCGGSWLCLKRTAQTVIMLIYGRRERLRVRRRCDGSEYVRQGWAFCSAEDEGKDLSERNGWESAR